MREILSGCAVSPDALARRNLVAANAAAALRVADLAESWPDAVQQALQIIASGAAMSLLEQLGAFTQSL